MWHGCRYLSYHVFWACPWLQEYWKEVINVVNSMGSLYVPADPLIFFLDIIDNIFCYMRLFTFFNTFYARREILLKWKLQPPLPCQGGRLQFMRYSPCTKLLMPAVTASRNLIRSGVDAHGLIVKYWALPQYLATRTVFELFWTCVYKIMLGLRLS